MPDQDEEATLARLREEFDRIKVTHLDQPPKSGANLIAEERDRQREVEGWTAEHDDQHTAEQIALAAACYVLPRGERDLSGPGDTYTLGDFLWPWDQSWWKPTPADRIRELVKAGALIAAEIDRLQRLEA